MSDVTVPTTVTAALCVRLAADPDGPYLDFEGDEWSARRMADVAARLAGAWRRYGIVRGDRIATLIENRPEQVVSFFAAAFLGAIQVPINTAYKGEFLRHVLVDSGARIVIVQEDLADRIALVAGPQTPDLEHVVVVGDSAAGPSTLEVSSWSDAIAAGAAEPVALDAAAAEA